MRKQMTELTDDTLAPVDVVPDSQSGTEPRRNQAIYLPFQMRAPFALRLCIQLEGDIPPWSMHIPPGATVQLLKEET